MGVPADTQQCCLLSIIFVQLSGNTLHIDTDVDSEPQPTLRSQQIEEQTSPKIAVCSPDDHDDGTFKGTWKTGPGWC